MRSTWLHRLRALCLALTVAGLSACGGGASDSSTSGSASSGATATQSTTLSASGGTLDGPDGVKVVVPSGALSTDTTITVQRTTEGAPAALPDGADKAAAQSAVYEITPHDVSFEQPVTVRIPVDTSKGTPLVYVSDLETGWYPHAVSAVGDGYVEVQRKGFSWFYAMAPAKSGDVLGSDVDGAVAAVLDIDRPVNMKLGGTAAQAERNGSVVYDEGNIALDTYVGVQASARFQASAVYCVLQQMALDMKVNGDWIELNQFPATAVETHFLATAADFNVQFTPLFPGEYDLRVRTVCENGAALSQADSRLANASWKMRMKVNPSYALGGTVSGLPTGGSVELALNGGTPQTVAANGAFTLGARQIPGTAYTLTTANAPAGYTCTASNATGTVGAANVTNVAVSCTLALRQVSGSFSGLPTGGSVQLLINGGQGQTFTNADAGTTDLLDFSLSSGVAEGSAYAITVGTVSPSNHACTVLNGAGTMGSTDATGVMVNCYPAGPFAIGGNTSGLDAGGPYPSVTYTLTDAAGVQTTRSIVLGGNGDFSLANVAGGSSYFAQIDTTASPAYTCFLVNGSGYADANKTNLGVSCGASQPGGGGIPLQPPSP